MDLRRPMAALTASIAVAPLVVLLLPAREASAHGWVTSPPSRQELCARGRVANCGQVQYEPQSVEAPKGARSCSGGSSFRVLDDEGRGWPATSVGSTVTITWQKTAPHRTLNWQYYLDGRLIRTVDGGNRQPSPSTSHTLSGLPGGRHKILAVWNIGDTVMAFYNCIDVQVGGGGSNPRPPGGGTPPPSTPRPPSGSCGNAWSASAVYTGGMTASHRAAVWRAKWWTQGEEPGTTGQWGVWEQIGTCGGRSALTEGEPLDEPSPGLGEAAESAAEASEGFGCSLSRSSSTASPGSTATVIFGSVLVLALARRRRWRRG